MRLFRRSAASEPPASAPEVHHVSVEIPPPEIHAFRPTPGMEEQAAARIARFTPAEREVWEWGQVTPTSIQMRICSRGGSPSEVDTYLTMYQINQVIRVIESSPERPKR